jgi:hypothetical protein
MGFGFGDDVAAVALHQKNLFKKKVDQSLEPEHSQWSVTRSVSMSVVSLKVSG